MLVTLEVGHPLIEPLELATEPFQVALQPVDGSARLAIVSGHPLVLGQLVGQSVGQRSEQVPEL
jgi:hypothetical protein